VQWAPDGRHFTIPRRHPGSAAEAQAVELFSQDGSVLTTISSADEAVWLDATSFVASTWHRRTGPLDSGSEVVIGPGGHPESTSYVVSADGLAVEELDVSLAGAVSNGAGVLATTTCRLCDGVGTVFRSWSVGSGLSQESSGVPISWSAAGDQLLVEHPLGEGPSKDRWMEILSWPGLDHFYGSREQTDALILDPDWQRRASWADDVVDIDMLSSGGTVATFEAPLTGEVVWDSADRLIIGDYSKASVQAYDLTGEIVASWDDIGQQVILSPDGSLMAWWHFDDGSRYDLTLIGDDTVERHDLPGPIDQLAFSPDGQTLLAVAFFDELLQVLLSPT
jgi:hypothetical protein